MPTASVLVTSAGTASAVNVIRSLRLCADVSVRILAVDADGTAVGLYLADRCSVVPKSSDPDYIPTLLRLCREHEVEALFPIHSQEIGLIAEHRKAFQDQQVALLLPDPETVQLCNDKRRMYQFVQELGIATPRAHGEDESVTSPLFAKPNNTSGSAGATRVEDAAHYEFLRTRNPGFLFQQFVQGTEITVDLLCDANHELVIASPRSRLATKAGQSVKGRTVSDPELVRLSATICRACHMVGPANMQWIRTDGAPVFLELNPRYAAGGLMLTVRAGANLPEAALQIMRGRPVPEMNVQPGLTMLRFWDEIILTDQELG